MRRILDAAVYEHGDGPPVVLLPSQLVIARAYQPTIKALARNFQVLTVEMPGVGKAAKLRAPWHQDDYADWLAEFFDELQLSPRPVIGHSNSAAAAIAFAAKYPEHVSKLILADPVGADPIHSIARVLAGRTIDAGIELHLSITGWPHLFYNLAHHPRNFFRQVRLAVDSTSVEVTRDVRAPTLLAWGRRDFSMRPAWSKRFLDALPHCQIYWSKTGSHDWIITHAEEFASAVRAFVAAETF